MEIFIVWPSQGFWIWAFACVCVHACRGQRSTLESFFSGAVHLDFWYLVLLARDSPCWRCWMASEFQGSMCRCLSSAGHTRTHHFAICFFFFSGGFWGLNSEFHSKQSKQFTAWTLSQALALENFNTVKNVNFWSKLMTREGLYALLICMCVCVCGAGNWT